jgi:hypothetical protein
MVPFISKINPLYFFIRNAVHAKARRSAKIAKFFLTAENVLTAKDAEKAQRAAELAFLRGLCVFFAVFAFMHFALHFYTCVNFILSGKQAPCET